MNDRSDLVSYFSEVQFGSTVIASLVKTPRIAVSGEVFDSRNYPDGNAFGARLLLRRSAEITVITGDVALAFELSSLFAEGQDVADPALCRRLVIRPARGSGRSLIFPAAWLNPDLVFRPELVSEHAAELTFTARSENGILFSYA